MNGTSIECVLPLTPLQEGQLFHARVRRGRPESLQHVPVGHAVRTLDVAALRSASARLQARHQCMRACFRQDRTNQTVQVVLREVPLLWRQIDLSGLPEPERAERLERLAQETRSDPLRPHEGAADPVRAGAAGAGRAPLHPLHAITPCWTDGLPGCCWASWHSSTNGAGTTPACRRHRRTRTTTAGWRNRTAPRRRTRGGPRSPDCRGRPCWRRLILTGGWRTADVPCRGARRAGHEAARTSPVAAA